MVPKISIITVCLNNIDGLRLTRDSIKKQEFRDFEWIVIDGNSHDGSRKFLHSIKDEVAFTSGPDQGIYDAMNKGIDIANGEYIIFLNAGDYFYNKEVLIDVCRDLNNDIVVGRLNLTYPDSLNKAPKIRRIDRQDVRKKYLYHKSIPHQATFIKRELFEIFGKHDISYKIYGDRDFFCRSITHGATLGFSSVCVSTFSMDGISTTMKGTSLDKKEVKKYRKKNFSKGYMVKRFIVDHIESVLKINQL